MRKIKLISTLVLIIFRVCLVLSDTKIASADYPAVYGGNGTLVSTATSSAFSVSIEVSSGKIRVGCGSSFGQQIDLIAGASSQSSVSTCGASVTTYNGTIKGTGGYIPVIANNSTQIYSSGGSCAMGDVGCTMSQAGIEFNSNRVRVSSVTFVMGPVGPTTNSGYGPWINLAYTCPSGGTLSGTTCVTPLAPTCTASWSPVGPLTAPGSATLIIASQNATSATYTCTGSLPTASNVAFSPSSSILFNNIGAGTKTCTISLTGPGGTVTNACSKAIVVNSIPACTGAIPANSNLAAVGDDVPAVDTPRTLVVADTTARCEYMCNTGYHYNAGVCEQNCTSECIDTMTACSKTCGGGTQSCTRKLPDCTESVVATSCNEQACPTVKRNLNWREVSPN